MASSIRGRVVRLLDTLVNKTHPHITTRSLSNIIGGNVAFRINSSSCSTILAPRMNDELRVCPCRGPRSSPSGHHPVRYLHEPGPQPDNTIEEDPAGLTQDDLSDMFSDIKKELRSIEELQEISKYYFDGQGKAVRPVITVLMARAINSHLHNDYRILRSQQQVAKVAEMIHTASLVHDDVIDAADTRRGKPSVNSLYGQRKAVMAGDYILSVASTVLAQIRNEEVVVVLAQVLSDLVQGEFMQLGSKENENERFAHYLKKTFKKTASLIAYSCKAVAILSGGDENLQEVAFQYGRNVGIAFQLVDDLLDFVASSNQLGKPTAIDLKLGLATAPVLFACEKFPELNPMIMRRFHEPGDVVKAFEYVHKSDGLQQTQYLARQHCQEAIRVIRTLKPSQEQRALISITDKVINRLK